MAATLSRGFQEDADMATGGAREDGGVVIVSKRLVPGEKSEWGD